VVWGGGSVSLARARHGEGAEVVAWPGADTAALVRVDVPVRPLEAVIGDEGLAAAHAAARTWARLWGRVPLLDGKSFRDLVEWRDTSLLWLAEAFIRHETAGPLCAGLAETALRLLEVTRAAEVDVVGLGRPETVVLSRACTTRGVTLVAACAAAGGVPVVVIHSDPVGPEDVDRADGGPRAAATVVWEPGSDPAPAVARLREVTRAPRAIVESE